MEGSNLFHATQLVNLANFTLQAKDKTKKNADNANFQMQHANSNLHEHREHREPVRQEPAQHVPAPPAAPAPTLSRGRMMNGRQMTPMPGKMKVT